MIKSKKQRALLIGSIALSAVNTCFAKTITNVNDIIEWLSNVSGILSTIFWILSGVLILWTAWDFLMSGGSDVKIKAARGRLMWIVVGIGVAILSSSIKPIVESLLKV